MRNKDINTTQTVLNILIADDDEGAQGQPERGSIKRLLKPPIRCRCPRRLGVPFAGNYNPTPAAAIPVVMSINRFKSR